MKLSKTLQFGLEEIMKDIGVKMSKGKSTNIALSFHDVLNDISNWLAEENGENHEIGDNVDELVLKKKLILTHQVRSAYRKNLKIM